MDEKERNEGRLKNQVLRSKEAKTWGICEITGAPSTLDGVVPLIDHGLDQNWQNRPARMEMKGGDLRRLKCYSSLELDFLLLRTATVLKIVPLTWLDKLDKLEKDIVKGRP